MLKTTMIHLFLGLVVYLGAASLALGHEPPTSQDVQITYALNVADPDSGDIEVSMLIENPRDSDIDIILPCWSPGRYIRDDFAALVNDERARLEGGRDLTIERLGSGVYRLPVGGESALFSYRIHAGRASVGTSLVESRGALLNPASLLPYLRGARDAPVSVFLSGPAGWRWTSALEPLDGPGRFAAQNWNALALSSILGGAFAEQVIETEGLRLRLVALTADKRIAARAATILQTMIPAAASLLGPAAKAESTIVLHALGNGAVTGFRANLESGLVVLGNDDDAQLAGLLAAATVGLFVGEALQPRLADLGDMTDIPMRNDLWVMPAFSRYLGEHLLARVGLISEQQVLARLAGRIEATEKEPAARRMSLIEAAKRMALRRADDPRSLPDDQKGNWIDPVLRGEVAALLLDLELRSSSTGRLGLADVVKDLDPDDEFSIAVLRRALESRGGRTLGLLFAQLLEETAVPAYAESLAQVGLRIEAASRSVGLGLDLKGDRVTAVRAGSSAARAGVQARDRILRIDGRPAGSNVGERIASMKTGSRTTITVERRGGIVTLPIAVEGMRRKGLTLVIVNEKENRTVLDGFLGREKQE